MATIKFNYGGVDYHLVAYSNKITTPSINVGGLYIPCFAGNIGQEIISGDKIFTLSPMNVGNYRAVCGARQGFVGGVFINLHVKTECGVYDQVLFYSHTGTVTSCYTNQDNFSSTVNVTSFSGNKTIQALQPSTTFNIVGTYTVTENSTGKVVKTGNFNVQRYFEHNQQGIHHFDYQIQIA